MILRMLSVGVRNLPIAHLSAYGLAYVPEQTKSCLSKVLQEVNRNARVVDSH
jgi:hypothetical protein